MIATETRPHLVVFFTRGMSLEGWHRAGILDRELAVYRELADDLGALTFVTYGDAGDIQWERQVPRLEVLPNRWGIPANLYSVIAPCLHWRRLREASLFRSNQINGAWCALVAKVLFRKPLVVRGGYVWSDVVARQTSSQWRCLLAKVVERVVIRAADRVVVAGEADAEAVASRGIQRASRVVVIPNYVDFSRFHPLADVTPATGRILCIGRLEHQKNIDGLIEAVRMLPDTTLTIVGDGSLRGDLERQAAKSEARVEFLGRLEQERLPALLCRSQVFVLPSHYEGNPKALFEAMACGVPVVGTRVPGIEQVLTDGVTGVLCGTTPSEIRDGLQRVLGDASLRERMRTAALAWVRDRCSLALAVARERTLLASFPS